MTSVDWSARPDQIEGLALREVGVSTFCLSKPDSYNYFIEIRPHPRTILYRSKNTSVPHKRCSSVLLRRHAYHQGVPADSQSMFFQFMNIERTKSALLQVLYNKDCISDQAIIYWHQKGSKPQGRQHFLKSTEPLVKVRPLAIIVDIN
jgi:hypothetical protein